MFPGECVLFHDKKAVEIKIGKNEYIPG